MKYATGLRTMMVLAVLVLLQVGCQRQPGDARMETPTPVAAEIFDIDSGIEMQTVCISITGEDAAALAERSVRLGTFSPGPHGGVTFYVLELDFNSMQGRAVSGYAPGVPYFAGGIDALLEPFGLRVTNWVDEGSGIFAGLARTRIGRDLRELPECSSGSYVEVRAINGMYQISPLPWGGNTMPYVPRAMVCTGDNRGGLAAWFLWDAGREAILLQELPVGGTPPERCSPAKG